MVENASASAPPHAVPYPVQMLEFAMRHWHAQCLYAAAKLRVADALAHGPLAAPALAAKVGAHPEHLGRLLRALASVGMFTQDDQGRFGLTPFGDVLRSDHPQSALGSVLMMGDEFSYLPWSALFHGVKTGEIPFEHLYKVPYFDYLNEHSEKEQLFAASMSSMAAPQNLAVARAYPFSEARVVMDVGGGNGHLLAAILRQHPAVKGILFDQPSVAEAAPANGFITAPDLNGRGSAVGGDMFQAIPKGADIYLLKSVLHDWDDERSVKILANCRDAMAPNSRILLVEGVIKPGTAPDFMKFVDLCMFVTSGGKERTKEEYTALLERAGLKLNRVLPTASVLSILEAVRV